MRTKTQLDSVKEYFKRIDAGDFATELFSSNCEYYFPKFGVGTGFEQFRQLAGGLHRTVTKLAHHQPHLSFIEAGNKVVVEGTTEGMSIDGKQWHGGQTPGGRFCSVFAFDSNGLIERKYVYLDPDYVGADKGRFLWNRGAEQRW